MIPTKKVAPTAHQLRVRDAIIAAIRKEVGNMSSEHLLAIFAYSLGQMIAFQNQNKVTIPHA